MSKIEEMFVVRPTNEKQNDFIVTIGKHLATEKHFNTKESAERYMKYPKWDTVLALIAEIKEVEEESQKIKNDAKSVVKHIIGNHNKKEDKE